MTMMMIMMLVCSVESIPSDNEDRPARVSDCMKSSHIQKTMKTMKTTPSTTSTPFETSFTSVRKMIFFSFGREPFCWLFVTRDWLFYTFQFTVCTAVRELFNYLLLSLKLYDIMIFLFIFLVGLAVVVGFVFRQQEIKCLKLEFENLSFNLHKIVWAL